MNRAVAKTTHMLRFPSILAVAIVCGVGIAGCGSSARDTQNVRASDAASGSATRSGQKPSSDYVPVKRDHDGDDDASSGDYYDRDDESVLRYGRTAGAADRHAISSLVKQYYAAVAAEDGSSACLLLTAELALGLSGSVDRMEQPGARKGNDCGMALSSLFKKSATVPASDVIGAVVDVVRVRGTEALALVRMRTSEVRQISAEEEDGVWKVDTLFDAGLR